MKAISWIKIASARLVADYLCCADSKLDALESISIFGTELPSHILSPTVNLGSTGMGHFILMSLFDWRLSEFERWGFQKECWLWLWLKLKNRFSLPDLPLSLLNSKITIDSHFCAKQAENSLSPWKPYCLASHQSPVFLSSSFFRHSFGFLAKLTTLSF